MENILRRDKSPLAENPFAKNDNSTLTPMERMTATAPGLDPEIQKHLTNFSLITHGFGGPAMVAALNAFRHYLNSMKTNYEKMMNIDSGLVNNTNNKSNYSMNRNYFNSSSSSSSSSSSTSSSSSSSNSRVQNPSLIELASLKVESKD